jgi:uncharacterized membrane protein YfcA
MKGVALILLLPDMQVGSKNEKKEPITPSLKPFPRITFSMWEFFIGLYYIFHTIFLTQYQFEAKYDI